MYQNQEYFPTIADILYGSFIRYDRLYEMTKFAFYGKTDSDHVNIYIDAYSILKTLYTRGNNIQVDDSCVIASCLINLAIHIRAYFESRHRVSSKVFIVYGGARPREAFVNYYDYNAKNIIMEDSNAVMKNLIIDNLNVVSILCPYLHDIFCVVDYENEFSVLASTLIDMQNEDGRKTPNIVYSKEPLAYQLVAFKPYTFLYRPKKKMSEDASWVVTKSTLYAAYLYGETNLKKELNLNLDVRMFSIFQSIAGVRSRNLNAIKNANLTVKLLDLAVASNIFANGYNANSIFYTNPNPFEKVFDGSKIDAAMVTNRFAAIDLPFQTMLFKSSIASRDMLVGLINLYDPQEVRNINDRYFQKYPLDLNRV